MELSFLHQTMEYGFIYFSWGYLYFSAGYFGYGKFHKKDVSMRELPSFSACTSMAA